MGKKNKKGRAVMSVCEDRGNWKTPFSWMKKKAANCKRKWQKKRRMELEGRVVMKTVNRQIGCNKRTSIIRKYSTSPTVPVLERRIPRYPKTTGSCDGGRKGEAVPTCPKGPRGK